MADTFDISHNYTIVFKAADGEHTASMSYAGVAQFGDKGALRQAKTVFGDNLVSVKRTTPQEHLDIMAENLADNPGRTPIDEKTNGVPNRIVHDPELAEGD